METSLSPNPIRAYRLRQTPPIKLRDLADRLSIDRISLWRIETGKQRVSDDLLLKIVAETGIPGIELRPDLAAAFENAEAAE